MAGAAVGDEVQISWQVQCFAGLEVPISISWQVKDFVDVEVQIDR